MTNITSLMPMTGSAIAPFSIGFAKLTVVGHDEDAAPAGSGALVTVGSIHGILTASHVLAALPDHGEVGLIQFTRNPSIQKLTIDMSLTEKLAIAGDGRPDIGPDIAFLRLSPRQVDMLNATTNVFFNLSKREESVLGNQHPACEYFEGLSGIIADWTISHSRGEAGFHRLKGFRGLFGVGNVARSRECKGYDLIDFETDREENINAPLNYQGMSGGALWRVYITTDNDGQPSVLDKRIFGVAFHQSERVEGMRTITRHGPKSVYGTLIRAVRNKWSGQ